MRIHQKWHEVSKVGSSVEISGEEHSRERGDIQDKALEHRNMHVCVCTG